MDESPPRGNAQPGDSYLWTIPVFDAVGRERELKVGVRRDRVVILLPAPGDGCTMTTDAADYLSASVRAASERAEMNR